MLLRSFQVFYRLCDRRSERVSVVSAVFVRVAVAIRVPGGLLAGRRPAQWSTVLVSTVLAATVLAASCGGGSRPESVPSPGRSSSAADAVLDEAAAAGRGPEGAAATEASVGRGAVDAVRAEAAPAWSVTTAAATVAVGEAPDTKADASSAIAVVADPGVAAETVVPSTTISERAWVETDDSELDSAMAVMIRDLSSHRVLAASFFYVTEERVAADICLGERGEGGTGYRSVQRIVDRGASVWEVSGRFDIRGHEGLESCVASLI